MRSLLPFALLLASPAWAVTHDVFIDDAQVSPDVLQVDPGDTVRWFFVGTVSQSSTAAAGQAESWDSGVAPAGTYYEHVFNTPGSFTYYDQTFGSDDGGGLVSGVSGVIQVNADTDADGLSDSAELSTWGTDPTNPDTDGDGLLDGEEVGPYSFQTDPLRADTDADQLTDGDEVFTYGTDPLAWDTDLGGLPDGEEVAMGMDPLLGQDDLPTSVLLMTYGPIAGTQNLLTADNFNPGNTVRLYRSKKAKQRTYAVCPDTWMELGGKPKLMDTAVVAADGTVSFTTNVPLTASGDWYMQALDVDACKASLAIVRAY